MKNFLYNKTLLYNSIRVFIAVMIVAASLLKSLFYQLLKNITPSLDNPKPFQLELDPCDYISTL